jgi:hypothetical protein
MIMIDDITADGGNGARTGHHTHGPRDCNHRTPYRPSCGRASRQ